MTASESRLTDEEPRQSTTEPELLELYEGTRHALEEAQATIDRQAALIGALRDVVRKRYPAPMAYPIDVEAALALSDAGAEAQVARWRAEGDVTRLGYCTVCGESRAEASEVIVMMDGCQAIPTDRVQALCPQHAHSVDPIGDRYYRISFGALSGEQRT